MNIFLRKTEENCFTPADDKSLKITKKLDMETVLHCEAWKERNYNFHKKYFALLNCAFENQDRYNTFEPFRAEVIMRAGYFNTHIHLSGKKSFSPKSIAFKKMDNIEFEELYSNSIDVILEHFLIGMNEDELNNAIDIIVGFC